MMNAEVNMGAVSNDLENSIRLNSLVENPGKWERVFSKNDVHPYDEIKWKTVDAVIKGPDGSIKFEQKNVEVPDWWSDTTINIVVSKYFRYINDVKETSVKQVFDRVVKTLVEWAADLGYFDSGKDAEIYADELTWLLLHQYGAFNSPVWFNLGVPDRAQQASACFISSVDDTLESIQEFAKSEKIIFAGGSGSGANLSSIRSSYEKLSSGAYVCGPIGWMEELDKGAKAMKSGGSTRNAAKMVVLDMDHPDILTCKDGRPGFIRCKAVEEKRAHDLIEIGYSAAYDDPNSAYKWVSFQNANHSVSIPDDFMEAVINDNDWHTKDRHDNIIGTYRAKDLWKEIAQAAWFCGDPGIQFTDIINKWHTTPYSGRIEASNPCSEFVHINDTACNLCAINLTKFFTGRTLSESKFEYAVRTFVVAQNAIVDKASYPTAKIKKNSHALRPIGLNYGDLGALLMKLGYGYDSDEGRAVAARMASMMTGYAYLTSAGLAKKTQPFPEFEKNRISMINVMKMHKLADLKIKKDVNIPNWKDIAHLNSGIWDDVISAGHKYGFSISQATLQAPLGTISFLMGMDTTGIEPAFSLVSYKELVGGGSMKLVNRAVPQALKSLDYSELDIKRICKYVEDEGCIEGAPGFKEEHIPIFDCAMPQGPSGRYLTPLAHIKMMGAIQPLITCAQSKTVNLPQDVTVEEIEDIHLQSWKLGIKCIALYRDGCKKSQPLSTKDKSKEEEFKVTEVVQVQRRELPSDCAAFRHRFEINGVKGYIITSEYEDGKLGEIFLKLGKSGSTLDGLIDGFTKLLSITLQHGVPLKKLIGSFVHTKFDPSGFTSNPDIRFCQSLYDYLFKYLDLRYYDGELSGIGRKTETVVDDATEKQISEATVSKSFSSNPPAMASDAPPCGNCGSITRRNGSCYLCDTCGTTTGCS